ncbi:MAG: hypothetical protein ACPLKQ_00995 [Candidatus Bathyarchaeales archaeon]
MFDRLSSKMEKTKRSYFRERVQQRQHLNREFDRLDKLLKENVIDEDIYKRLRKLLEIGYQQKIQETRRKYGFPCNFVRLESTPNPDGNRNFGSDNFNDY